ncbi:hypothetical protein D7Y15_26225 [Corallococcus sp. AB030]|uniref:hypothetical protein n=1 Tax=Corallococcus sp. AB030 TaxID=2316716 RepID=UPI000ECF2D7A|nr:hypothetical protein [Corallococcus sp. AB030]RKI08305.1 hypothetical protein D7Y15_26225 [Corallococcus sp. AB030]
MRSMLKLVLLVSLLISSMAFAAAAPPPADFGSAAHVAEVAKFLPQHARTFIDNCKILAQTAADRVGAKFGWKSASQVPSQTLECMAYKIQLGYLLKQGAKESVPPSLIAWVQFQARRACGEDDDGRGDSTKGKAALVEAAKVLPGLPMGPANNPNRAYQPEHSKPVPQREGVRGHQGPLPEKDKQTVATIKPNEAWTPAQAAAVTFAIAWAIASEFSDVMTLGLP